MRQRFQPWFDAQGDKTLRLEYDLSDNSTVFDLGGYEGQWASDIFSRYCCNIFIFEPVPAFANAIQRRYVKNTKIRVFPFGLSSTTQNTSLSLRADSSSQFKKSDNSVPVTFIKAADFLAEHDIKEIDLMKINIEGGEYDLLDHLIETGTTDLIRNIQVQFHDFIPDAKTRMVKIQERLSTTHTMTYSFPFVWENWQLKNIGHDTVIEHLAI